MTKIILLLITLLASSIYSTNLENAHGTENLADFDELLIKGLELLRKLMRTGLGENNLILAPLKIDKYYTDIAIGNIIDLVGPLSDMIISGLDGFIVNGVHVDPYLLRVDFNINFPNIITKGFYDLVGHFGQLIPIYGNGKLFLSSHDWTFEGYGQFTIDNNDYLHMEDFYLRLRMKSIDSDIEGLLGGGDLGELMNILFQDVLITVYEKYHKEISNKLNEIIMPLGNSFLSRITLLDLINIINNQTDIN